MPWAFGTHTYKKHSAKQAGENAENFEHWRRACKTLLNDFQENIYGFLRVSLIFLLRSRRGQLTPSDDYPRLAF